VHECRSRPRIERVAYCGNEVGVPAGQLLVFGDEDAQRTRQSIGPAHERRVARANQLVDEGARSARVDASAHLDGRE
jgi:hypothetical protein